MSVSVHVRVRVKVGLRPGRVLARCSEGEGRVGVRRGFSVRATVSVSVRISVRLRVGVRPIKLLVSLSL